MMKKWLEGVKENSERTPPMSREKAFQEWLRNYNPALFQHFEKDVCSLDELIACQIARNAYNAALDLMEAEIATLKAQIPSGYLKAFRDECDHSFKKHGGMPDDIIHSVAVMCEESGEAIQAAIQFTYEGGSIENVREELIQTGAMCLKALEALPTPPESEDSDG